MQRAGCRDMLSYWAMDGIGCDVKSVGVGGGYSVDCVKWFVVVVVSTSLMWLV